MKVRITKISVSTRPIAIIARITTIMTTFVVSTLRIVIIVQIMKAKVVSILELPSHFISLRKTKILYDSGWKTHNFRPSLRWPLWKFNRLRKWYQRIPLWRWSLRNRGDMHRSHNERDSVERVFLGTTIMGTIRNRGNKWKICQKINT